MKCLTPYQPNEAIALPCGKCEACRHNYQHTLVGRIKLEANAWPREYVTVFTLTYNDENCPAELVQEDMTRFLKRLRKALPKKSFRYYYCGEYGSKTDRPHWHGILFGINPYSAEKLIEEKWGKGFIKLTTYDDRASSYVAKYITKGTSGVNVRQDGKRQEFARWSRKPPLGASPEVVKNYMYFYEKHGEVLCDRFNWHFPAFVQIGRVPYPMCKSLKEKVAKELGFQPFKEIGWNKPLTEEEKQEVLTRLRRKKKRLGITKTIKSTL